MVAQLTTLAQEVSRVSLEVGTDGILGGQAFVPGVQGMWKVRSHPFVSFSADLLYFRLSPITSTSWP